MHRFTKEQRIPVVHFAKGENKEQAARPLIEKAAAEGGQGRVVLIGIAQDKAPGLAAFDPDLPAELTRRSPLATAWRTLNRELDRHIGHGLAAA